MSDVKTQTQSAPPSVWSQQWPLTHLRSELDNLFEHFFGSSAVSGGNGLMVPSVDVSETDNAIEVKTDVPGFKADDINVEVRDDMLTVSGEYSTEEKSNGDEKRKFHRVERRSGSFSRSVRLPCEVMADKVDAELKDGVLTVVLPKSAATKAQKISIRS